MVPRSSLIRLPDVLGESASLAPRNKNARARRPMKIRKGETIKVHFRECTDGIFKVIHLVPALVDLTEQEKESLWLTRRDLEIMDEQLRVDIIRSSLQHHHTELGENPTRGLEWKIFDGIRQRNINRKKCITAVLQEQQRRRSHHRAHPNEVVDMNLITKSYQEVAAYCQDRARKVAIQDFQVASRINLCDEDCSDVDMIRN